jgi:hypothetical protein
MLMSTAESFADDGGRFFGPYKGGMLNHASTMFSHEAPAGVK